MIDIYFINAEEMTDTVVIETRFELENYKSKCGNDAFLS